MLTISNPFDILFFAGILPAILPMGAITWLEYIVCCVVIVAGDAVVALSYAVPIALTRRFFTRNIVRKLNFISSIGIILVGLYIGYTAFPAIAP
jgi:threonine/homoserine/homoserine lactone efflux protein